MKRIAILGSTGSIGTQTLDIISRHNDRFSVEVLTANNSIDLLIEQALKYNPGTVVVANETHYPALRDALSGTDIKVFAGIKAVEQVASSSNIDIVVTAMVGFSGLAPTIEAVRAGKVIALANKETLVVAGELISQLMAIHRATIIPVDSEHSAILQCLVGETGNPVEKITLTASGGPFRKHTLEQLRNVTPEEALDHPNWDMGNKITVDSASMMNKGLEVIEARWLFDLQPDQIDVIIHPQSVIHSMVHFADSSVKAQLGVPDMRLPILYALEYPDRIVTNLPRLNLEEYDSLTFQKVDLKKFRNLALAYEALRSGGTAACVMNAANEVAVESFLGRQIGFLQMTDLIEEVMNRVGIEHKPSLETLQDVDAGARRMAKELVKKLS